MTDLIRDIANIDVPNDLLDQIDVTDVLERFRQKFKRLDDLKKFREEHEQRNFISRWWNNDELDNAQLNAQQLQAEFSKSLGQLMVISMLQSQRLEQQQLQMSRQQDQIQLQASRILAHTHALDVQHGELSKQAAELKKLVEDYFELRGLTQEGAKKLIAIANEVKGTRDELLSSFGARMDEAQAFARDLGGKVDTVLAEYRRAVEQEREHSTQRIGELTASMMALAADVQARRNEDADRHAQHVAAMTALDAATHRREAACNERLDVLTANLASLERAVAERAARSAGETRTLKLALAGVAAVALIACALLATLA